MHGKDQYADDRNTKDRYLKATQQAAEATHGASLLRPVLARTGGGRRLDLLIIVLIVVFATTKNLAPEAFFLLVLVLGLGLGRTLVYGCRLPLHWDGAAATYIRRRRGGSWLGFNAKNSLENVAVGRLLT